MDDKYNLKEKNLKDLVDGMMGLIVKKPQIISDPNYLGEDKKLYIEYKKELNTRGIEYDAESVFKFFKK